MKRGMCLYDYTHMHVQVDMYIHMNMFIFACIYLLIRNDIYIYIIECIRADMGCVYPIRAHILMPVCIGDVTM